MEEREQPGLQAVQLEVVALRPLYCDDTGDGTEIILRSGERLWQPRRIRAVRAELAHLFGVDLVAVRRRYGQLLARSSSVPLPLAAHLILVPLRLRRPRCRGDASLGYVSLHEVKEVRDLGPGPFRCALILASGAEVPALSHRRVVLDHLNAARRVEEQYLAQQGWKLPTPERAMSERLNAFLRELSAHYLF